MVNAIDVISELQKKRKELALIQRKAKLLQTNGLAFYRPHAKQALFHSMAHKKYRFARTGNRFGKSEMGSAEDVAVAYGERLWLPKSDPMRKHGIPSRPTKGLIISTDWDKSTEVFTNRDGSAELGKLFRFIPSEAVGSVQKNHSGAIDKIVVKRPQGMGESIIQIDTVKSYVQNPMGQESGVFDWIHVDEPCPRGMWIANSRGLIDRGGKAWFTCTPLTELWINDFFVPNRRAELKGDAYEEVDKFMMIGSTYDNPYLSQKDVADFEATLDADEISCRINGIPLALAGLVYKEFDPGKHILTEVPIGWKNFETPPLNACIRFAIDPHPKKPSAVLFVATLPTGHSMVYDEIWEPALIREVAALITTRLAFRDPQDALIDPIANTPDPINGRTMKEEFLANDVLVTEAVKDPSFGILKVKEYLKSTTNGSPTLSFSPNCTRTIWEFDHFLWDPKTGKPKKEHDDMLENLYRICLRGLDYMAPVGKDDYVRIVHQPITETRFSRSDMQESLFESTSPVKPLWQRLRSNRRKTNDAW